MIIHRPIVDLFVWNVIRYSSWKPKMEAWRESKRAACPQDLWLELIHQYQPFLDIGGRLVNGAESSFIYTSSRAQVNKSRNKKNIMRPPTSLLVAASVVSSFFLSLFRTVHIILFFNAW